MRIKTKINEAIKRLKSCPSVIGIDFIERRIKYQDLKKIAKYHNYEVIILKGACTKYQLRRA